MLAIITTINANYQRYWSSIIRGVDEGWLPEFMGKRNKHGIPWVLMVLCAACTILLGIFVVLNVIVFKKMVAVFVVVYFAVTLVISFVFGDKLLAKGAARLEKKQKA